MRGRRLAGMAFAGQRALRASVLPISDAMSLVWRVLLLWLVVLALLVIAGWVR